VRRDGKIAVVERVRGALGANDSFVFMRSNGMTVGESTRLRFALAGGGARLMCVKNSLACVAFKQAGGAFDEVAGKALGLVLMAYSSDLISLSKAVCTFANDKKNVGLAEVVMGLFGGKVVDRAGVERMATMPSADEMRASIVHYIGHGPARLVSSLQQNPLRLVRVLRSYVDQVQS
jgi:large subunit ribosomal protein L10